MKIKKQKKLIGTECSPSFRESRVNGLISLVPFKNAVLCFSNQSHSFL